MKFPNARRCLVQAFAFWLLICSAACLLKAQQTAAYNKVTKIELGTFPSDTGQVRFASPSPTLVEANTTVELYTAAEGEESPRWLHESRTVVPNERIKLLGRTLRIERLQAEDAGVYYTEKSFWMMLKVGRDVGILNTSARGTVGAGGKVLVAGLVIDGTETRKMLIRAVGPSLAKFGIKDALAEPKLEIFDAEGKKYSNYYSYATTVGFGYGEDLENSTNKVGAFRLEAGSKDAVELLGMVPGIYTLVVSGLNGSTGTALIEAYQVKE